MKKAVEIEVVETIREYIDEKQQIKIAISILCEAANLPEDFYIKDGNVMEDIEYHTSHTWFDEKTLRKATKLDKATAKVIDNLRQYEKDL